MIQNDIEQLISPSVEEMGYELWGCEYISQGSRSMLRIYIDKQDGIGIEDCEQVSRQISAILDVNDPISGHYSLEVSSPGIPRPLFKEDQYNRYLGFEVGIKLYKLVDGKRKFEGTIKAVRDHVLVLDIAGVEQEFNFSNIVKANLTV